MFKKINSANAILRFVSTNYHKMKSMRIVDENQLTHVFSDEKKRQLYDEYGSFGLYLADQVH